MSDTDFKRLSTFISVLVQKCGTSAAIERFAHDTPASLATFLVFAGVHNYCAGDFWSAVHNITGIPSKPVWQGHLSDIFRKLITSSGLPTFENSSGPTNIMPILAHGPIPDYCLQDFFQNFLSELILGRYAEKAQSNLLSAIADWTKGTIAAQETDKPIIWFLQSHEPIVHKFIRDCMQSVNTVQSLIEEDARSDALPFRIAKKFLHWRKTGSTGTELETRVESSRFQKPELIINPSQGTFCIFIPRQRIFYNKQTPTVTVDVLWDDFDTFTISQKLKYRVDGDYLVTASTKIPCRSTGLALIAIQANSKTIKEYEIDINKSTPYFFTVQYKVAQEPLPDKCWTLLPKDWHIEEGSSLRILEESAPFQVPWSGHRAYLVQSSYRSLRVIGPDNASISQKVQTDEPQIILADTALMKYVSSEARPVYCKMPHIRFSGHVEGEAEVTMIRSVPGTTIADTEITSIDARGDVNILNHFKAFMPHLPIDYRITIKIAEYQPILFAFMVMPNLHADFEQPLYYAAKDGKISIARCNFTCAIAHMIAGDSNEEITKIGDGNWRIAASTEVGAARLTITGKFDGGEFSAPLTIHIPCVRFKLDRLTNMADIGNFAFSPPTIQAGELAQMKRLVVQFTHFYPKEVSLQFAELQKCTGKYSTNGTYIFDLARFGDTFKSKNVATGWLDLVIDGTQERTLIAPALELQADWRVHGLKVISGTPEELVKIEWLNDGFSQNRALRMWDLTKPWLSPLIAKIQDTVNSARLQIEGTLLHPGPYRLEFYIDDGWSSCPTVPAEPDRLLVHDIVIGSSAEITNYRDNLCNSFESELSGVLLGIYNGTTASAISVDVPDELTESQVHALMITTLLLMRAPKGQTIIERLWHEVKNCVCESERLVQKLEELSYFLSHEEQKAVKDFIHTLAPERIIDAFSVGQYVRHATYGDGRFQGRENGNVKIKYADFILQIPESEARHLTPVIGMPRLKIIKNCNKRKASAQVKTKARRC